MGVWECGSDAVGNVFISDDDRRAGESALAEEIGQRLHQPVAQHDLVAQSGRVHRQRARGQQRGDLLGHLRHAPARGVDLFGERVVQRPPRVQQCVQLLGGVVARQQRAVAPGLQTGQQRGRVGAQANDQPAALERGPIGRVQ